MLAISPSNIILPMETQPKPQKETSTVPLTEKAFSLIQEERLWFLSEKKRCFNVLEVASYQEAVEFGNLQIAVNRLVHEEEILRTVYDFEGISHSVQVILQDAKVTVMRADLSQCGKHADTLFSSICVEEEKKPFSLKDFPLVRFWMVSMPGPSTNLLVVSHPIVADKASLRIILKRLLVDLRQENDTSMNQSLDYLKWQTFFLNMSEDLALYWRSKLSGSLHTLQIPLDFTRDMNPKFLCQRSRKTLSSELTQKVINFGKNFHQIQNSMYVTLVSVFKLLLFRYTSEEDVIIGTVVNGRNHESFSNTIGPLSRALPLRTFIDKSMSFSDLLSRVQDTVNGALSHQDVLFENILNLLGISHQDNPTPIFQVLFELETSEPDGLFLENVDIAITSPYDLWLKVKLGQVIELEVRYNAELILRSRAEEILSQLEYLLSQIIQNPEANIISYSLITEKARSVIPDPTAPLDNTWQGPIHDRLSLQAKQNPDRIAIVYQGNSINYSQLERYSNQLANYLISKGIKPNDVIGLYGHRSPAVVVVILGILKTGAAYTMMDPAYPFERIEKCLSIAKIKGWIQIRDAGTPPQKLQKFLGSLGLLVVLNYPQPWIGESEKLFEDIPASPPNITIPPNHVAVVTFTSGSTGTPKGVRGQHLSLTHFYPWMSLAFGLSKDDKFSMVSGIAHDPLQRDIFTPIFFGASIHIPHQDDITTPGRLGMWMKENQISVTCMTPALGQILTTVDNPNFTIDTLKNSFFVGDCLIKRDVYRLKKLAPNGRIINMYGSTETQRAVGHFVIPDDPQNLKEVIPCGKGMKDVDLLVLNVNNKLCGIGELGEIFVRSSHLSLGYLESDEMNEKKFLPNFFRQKEEYLKDGDRLYRTGDLGRYGIDGNLECLGRADEQVKIRGFRIELGEINATLSQHPSIKENVTVLRQDKPGDKMIVSYAVLVENFSNSSQEDMLKEFLRSKLPQYMVPTRIVILKSMPLTPNGKINRDALPIPETFQPLTQPKNTSVEISETESRLLKVWSKVFGFPVEDVNLRFDELGGHSVLATRLNFEMTKEFGKEIPTSLLFTEPSNVASIACYITGTNPESQELKASLDDLRLDQEVVLPEDLIITEDISKYSGSTDKVFLTGSTGFLGAFLLREILMLKKTSIAYCHVRANSVAEGLKRLTDNLKAHLLWDESFEGRIIAVPGDLSQPLLGLTPEEFKSLSTVTDLIIHNGAYVHWLYDYQKLKPTNVQGTIEILKFAVTGKLKPVHHVSTTSVFDTNEHKKLEVVLENDNLKNFEGLKGGYPRTKWVSERLVLEARKRGVPVSIYRPGYVVGDSKFGIWNVDDFLCRLIKACILLKAYPIINSTLDMSSVDYVCGAIVYLAMNRPVLNQSFNVVNPVLFSFSQMFESVVQCGYNMEAIDYQTWCKKLKSVASEDTDNPLSSMLSHFTESWPETLVNPVYDSTNTVSSIKDSNIPILSMEQLMPKYLTYFVQCGFIEAPAFPDKLPKWDGKNSELQLLIRTNRHGTPVLKRNSEEQAHQEGPHSTKEVQIVEREL